MLERLRRGLNDFTFEVAAVAIAIVLAAMLFPSASAQGVWNDVRHEITVRNDPQSFNCNVINSNATILTALGGTCVAPTAVGQSLYITDISATASAAATTSADSFLELKTGTGGSCGTGTAVVWASYNAANAGAVQDLTVPIKVAANSELCWMDAVVGSKTVIVSGYIK